MRVTFKNEFFRFEINVQIFEEQINLRWWQDEI